MDSYLPYIVSALCSAIAGFASYAIARKQAKTDLQKIEKQHAFDIEKEHELFAMEKERLEIEHQHQIELLQKQLENSMGSSVVSTLMTEVMKMPEVREQLSQGIRNGTKKKQ